MTDPELLGRIADLTTPHLADGCVRVGVPVRCAPAGIRSVTPGDRFAGRVLPARHVGSVDVFLEALHAAEPGDVLVADNSGRLDESCVGDLMVLEALGAGAAGLLVWGLHRDTDDIRRIGLPLFSLGSIPTGPLRLDPRPHDALESATVGDWAVGTADLTIGDEDGVLFIAAASAAEVVAAAEEIRDTERRQAELMASGKSLRAQVHFDEYLRRRATDPGLGLREHLRTLGGAIEV